MKGQKKDKPSSSKGGSQSKAGSGRSQGERMPQTSKAKNKKSEAPKVILSTVPQAQIPEANSLTHPNLSVCATDYVASLANPFQTGPTDPCIPDAFALLTEKRTAFAKGSFATSANAAAAGFGCIVMSPWHGISNNSNKFVTVSLAAYANNFYNNVGVINGFNSNSPYTNAQVGSDTGQIQYRLVSAGLKIRALNADLDRAGVVVGLQEPNHMSFNNTTYSQMQAYTEATTKTLNQKPLDSDGWLYVTYVPVHVNDIVFRNAQPGTGDNLDCDFMGFFVQARDTTGVVVQAFEWEAWAHYEVTGTLATNKTLSDNDPIGYAAGNVVASQSPVIGKAHSYNIDKAASAVVQAAGHYVKNSMSKPENTKAIVPHKSHDFDWGAALNSVGSVVGTILSIL